MQMQILKYVHIKIRKGSKEKSSDHSCPSRGTFLLKICSIQINSNLSTAAIHIAHLPLFPIQYLTVVRV